jgi:3-oxoacyl-[acyl-carrier-protein] synthase III
MSSETAVKIIGSGTFLPGKPIPIDKIGKVLGELEYSPRRVQKWLSGMKPIMKELLEVEYYHYAIDPDTREFTDDNLSMSVKAAQEALKRAGMIPDEVELIIYGGPYMYQMPVISAQIQDALGIEQCAELAIQANCSSAYKIILLAHDLIKNGRYKNALVISSNMASAQLRSEHYNQELVKKEDLFLRYFLCDGAGAFLLRVDSEKREGFYLEDTYMESVGGKKPSAMYTLWPAYYLNPKEVYEKGYHHLKQMFQKELKEHFHEEGGTVFFHGVKRMINKYNLDLSKLRYFQINMPSKHVVDLIIDECNKLNIHKNQIYSSIKKMGYPGPPAALIALDKIMREEKLEDGDLILSFVTEVSKFMQAGFTVRYYS